MKTNIKILSMTRIILFISCLFLVSCVQENSRKYYKTTDGGYCYQDSDMLWHMYIYDTATGGFVESTTSTAPSYDASSSYSTADVEATTGVDMAETTGEDTGGSDMGSDIGSDSSDGGMGESGGSDSGGFDGGGFDGGGDAGGGDGGGGE